MTAPEAAVIHLPRARRADQPSVAARRAAAMRAHPSAAGRERRPLSLVTEDAPGATIIPFPRKSAR